MYTSLQSLCQNLHTRCDERNGEVGTGVGTKYEDRVCTHGMAGASEHEVDIVVGAAHYPGLIIVGCHARSPRFQRMRINDV